MTTPESVANLLNKLRSDDPSARNQAAAEIWKAYSHQLLVLARNHLNGRIRLREDENDVLQSMYKSFCQRLQRGRFTFENREDIRKLLVAMTRNKARKAARRHQRENRDVRREQHAQSADSTSMQQLIDLITRAETTPTQAAMFTDTLQRLLDILPQDRMRHIVTWKLDGYTNEEIARQLGCVVRTVERKLEVIRETWAKANLLQRD